MLLCLHISGTWISILTVVQYQVWGRRHSQNTQKYRRTLKMDI